MPMFYPKQPVAEQLIIERFNSGCQEFKKAYEAYKVNHKFSHYKDASRKCVLEIFGALIFALETNIIREIDKKCKKGECLFTPEDSKLFNKRHIKSYELVNLYEKYDLGIDFKIVKDLQKLKEIERNAVEHSGHVPDPEHLELALCGIYDIMSKQIWSELVELTDVPALITKLKAESFGNDIDVEIPTVRFDVNFNLVATDEEITVFFKQIDYRRKAGEQKLFRLQLDLKDVIQYEVANFNSKMDINTKSQLVSYKLILQYIQSIERHFERKTILLLAPLYHSSGNHLQEKIVLFRSIIQITREYYTSVYKKFAEADIKINDLALWDKYWKSRIMHTNDIDFLYSGPIPSGLTKIDIYDNNNPLMVFSVRLNAEEMNELLKNIGNDSDFKGANSKLPSKSLLQLPMTFYTSHLPQNVILKKAVPTLIEKLHWMIEQGDIDFDSAVKKYQFNNFYIGLG